MTSWMKYALVLSLAYPTIDLAIAYAVNAALELRPYFSFHPFVPPLGIVVELIGVTVSLRGIRLAQQANRSILPFVLSLRFASFLCLWLVQVFTNDLLQAV
jgi:hypothetical protein